MHDLIAFQVEGPVPGAGILGNHFLLGIDKAAVGHALVPQGLNDPDLGVADGPDTCQCVVTALADRHHKLVHQRQQ